jgi:hypothetical protein
MDVGMLWFDNDPRTPLSAKVENAAKYYRQKYAKVPNLCLIHPAAFTAGLSVEGVTVRPNRAILPGHLWIGTEEEGEK